jgi:hypothetical protein
MTVVENAGVHFKIFRRQVEVISAEKFVDASFSRKSKFWDTLFPTNPRERDDLK